MEHAIAILRVVNLVLFGLAAIVAVRQWQRQGGHRSGLWAALAFLSLGLVVVLGRLVPERPDALHEHVAQRVEVVLFLLFPYLLYRFTTAFRQPTLRMERLLAVMTVVLLVATATLPYFPAAGEARPWWFLLYLGLFLLHWTVLSVLVAVRLWRAGTNQPSVARKRMRTLAAAAILLTVALFLVVGESDRASPLGLASALVGLASGAAFLLGLAPPATLRLLWRRPEQRQMQVAVGGLMTATTPGDVAAGVLPPLAEMVGARAAAIYGADGELLGSHGELPDEVGDDVTTTPFADGRLVVQTTPFAPYFGDEEGRLLTTIASLAGVALDRARLFGQEQEAREALERADELKSEFVALAAHELRTPVAAIYGFSETLRRGDLRPEQRELVENQVHEQAGRLRTLVEQLLDLSRLEAEAVAIRPERVVVVDRLREIVAGTVPADQADVIVEADPRLEALVDQDALERIVSNLVVNAFRYGRPPIVIRAGAGERGLSVVVEDAGPGVPAELVPQLFERFVRGGGQGSGLGLAIARSYARAHRGELSYRPGTPHGAAFEVVLPAA